MSSSESLEIACNARAASLVLQSASVELKNRFLSALQQHVESSSEIILEENKRDLEIASKSVEEGSLSVATFKRLDLWGKQGEKLTSLIEGVADVQKMPDPCGSISLAKKLDDGLELYRVSCPVGVLLVIFEARPEVLIQITSLAVKSGNAVILKGGKEAAHSLKCLHGIVVKALVSTGLDEHCVQLIFGREEVAPLLQLDKYIDLVIPRGSNSLVRQIQESTHIPVLGHADGLCSIYVHNDASVDMAIPLILDAKTDYPAACNAVETLLVHEDIAEKLLPGLFQVLHAKHVELRVTQSIYNQFSSKFPFLQLADSKDFDTEFIDLVLAIKTVASLKEAILHINTHGSRHTDSILTESKSVAHMFMHHIDSAGVYWNASTRFADGYRYGFGAEIGVSTNKTHARGPVGLEGLMIYKYKLVGEGHCVSWFNQGLKSYAHQAIDPSEYHQFQ